MAEISFESLALLFITVLLASLIGGFITVHFGTKSQRSQNHHTPTAISKHSPLNKSRNSMESLTPNRAPHGPLPSSSNVIHRTPPAKTQPQYTQNTTVPVGAHPTLFQYPPMKTIYNASNIIHDTIHPPQFIPPAPHQPPMSNSISPQTVDAASKTGHTQPNSIAPRNFNERFSNKQYHQPNKGNISSLRTQREPTISNSLPIPATQNQNGTRPQPHESFGSSQKLTFNQLNAKIMKFPPQSSMRVTEKKTDDCEHCSQPPSQSLDGAMVDGQKMNFFNLPPINRQQPQQEQHIHHAHNNNNNNLQNENNNNNARSDSQAQSQSDGSGGIQMQKKQSFPDDIPPSTLLSPDTTPRPRGGGQPDMMPPNIQMPMKMMKMKRRLRLIIVCYKLPLKCHYNATETQWEFEWEDIRNVLANLRVLESRSPSEYEVVFVGWPGVSPSTYDEQEILEDALYSLKYPCYPIFLTESQIRNCYKIYCRSILWPLFHYLMPTNDYQFGNNYEKYWQSYVGLNNLYAKKACVAATDGPLEISSNEDYIIWFHDYHLLLAPHFVRRQIPLAQIGLFLHTTFPTSEVFRCLPTRKEILRGILSSDLVGFHTYDYARHFLSACKRILDLDFHTLPDDGTLAVHYLGRDVSLRIGHASILSHDIHKTAQSQKVRSIRNTFWRNNKLNIGGIASGKKKIILGLGELDEVRGTILTIQSFHRFLDSHPEWQNDIIFILLISTHSDYNSDRCHFKSALERSRSYSKLRQPIEDEINKMCIKFKSNNVIQLIDSNHLSYNELLALYTLCDVAVFATFWDGFNTVPYEFTAAQPSYDTRDPFDDDDMGMIHGSGTTTPPAVILSEFMGCMRSLCGVFRINPWKISQVASTIHTALCMTSKERRVAHHRRFSHVMKYTLIDWSKGFLNDLKKAARSERNKRVLPIGFGSNLRFIYIPSDLTNLKQTQKLLINSFKRCKYKVLLLDYGGTLTDVDEMVSTKEEVSSSKDNKDSSYRDLLGITKDLQSISPKIIHNLQRISSDPDTLVAIVSGQTRENLDAAFEECPNLFICAEKGAYFRYPNGGSKWCKNDALPSNDCDMLVWQTIVHDVLKTYTERTNGSYIQKKSTALVWHYENADPHYGDMQATEAERYLRRIIEKHHNLLVQRYDHCRALEVLPKEINKGAAALKVMDEMMKYIDYNEDDTTGNNIWFMAVGNDRSDEKMFEAVELVSRRINTEYGFTVRIGMAPTQARFYLTDHNQMLWLLNTLATIITSSAEAVPVPVPVPPPLSSMATSGSISTAVVPPPPIIEQQPEIIEHLAPTAIPPTATNQNGSFADMVSPEYNGSFFDNVAVRSHSYTSLSRLARLAQLNEEDDDDRDDDDGANGDNNILNTRSFDLIKNASTF